MYCILWNLKNPLCAVLWCFIFTSRSIICRERGGADRSTGPNPYPAPGNKLHIIHKLVSCERVYNTRSGPNGPRRTEVKEDQMKNVNIEALKEQFTETREYGSDVLFAVRSIMLDVVMNSTHEPATDFSVFTLWDMLNDISDLETYARIYSKVAEDNNVPVVPVGYIEITEEGGFYFIPEDAMSPTVGRLVGPRPWVVWSVPDRGSSGRSPTVGRSSSIHRVQ